MRIRSNKNNYRSKEISLSIYLIKIYFSAFDRRVFAQKVLEPVESYA